MSKQMQVDTIVVAQHPVPAEVILELVHSAHKGHDMLAVKNAVV
jgi:hypothetical protein